jgi:hypothetical protein
MPDPISANYEAQSQRTTDPLVRALSGQASRESETTRRYWMRFGPQRIPWASSSVVLRLSLLRWLSLLGRVALLRWPLRCDVRRSTNPPAVITVLMIEVKCSMAILRSLVSWHAFYLSMWTWTTAHKSVEGAHDLLSPGIPYLVTVSCIWAARISPP